jgi:hypothetical protein
MGANQFLRFSGPTPSNGPSNGFAPIKIIKSRGGGGRCGGMGFSLEESALKHALKPPTNSSLWFFFGIF